jgi:hypothetical protein
MVQGAAGCLLAAPHEKNAAHTPHPPQGEVDVLVEDARKMAVEVEHKVASANVFAEQVGVEKEKVAAENESAKVEAEKCAVIAKEVSEKQARGARARGGLGSVPCDESGVLQGAGHACTHP